MVVNSKERYRKVLFTALAAALLLVMMLALSVQPVFSSHRDGHYDDCEGAQFSSDDYGQCVLWASQEGNNEAKTATPQPTPEPTATPDGSD